LESAAAAVSAAIALNMQPARLPLQKQETLELMGTATILVALPGILPGKWFNCAG
jgi:hypothetical protein